MVRMYQWTCIHGGVLGSFLVLLSALLLGGFPSGVRAQENLVASQKLSEPSERADDASDTLTAAQREAQQLAATLGRESMARRATSSVELALPLVPEQVLQPGRRLIVTIFSTSELEGRLLGGVQTFASPVETTADTARDDARRLQFLPADASALGLEILAK